ncbi:MAG: biotin-dependent carboxyltransferase family protein [Saprospirales bacterium]|nr:biotin-dependent carboxyltransferase family protein [Saprospirales bacterium]
MSLQVLKSGLLDTIQDRGRFGYAHLGINPSGAMDTIALALANMLVGNPAETAALELHFPGPRLRFELPALFALGGGDFMPRLNGVPIPVHTPVAAGAGSVLSFSGIKNGARAYLAVRGGFRLEPWLGSRSTNRAAGAGGFQGRALQTGDLLAFEPLPELEKITAGRRQRVSSWSLNTSGFYPPGPTMRFCAGPEYDWLDTRSKHLLENNDWLITPQSDRMGYRMQGAPLQMAEKQDLISSVVTPGTLQLLPNGSFIILMADSQTTGGYPRVGQLITADLPGLAQMLPGQHIRLCPVDPATAFATLRQQDQLLRKLQWSCTLRLKGYGLEG